ncbi:multiple epidermal growth factor-like domains protein 10 [Crassostrea angulata]|uniref:multiple epidermal growth factor-like domains protein 10 n=1 Tax=Magallana angulata TaxID=2784310 RepID=UPI0022B1C31E|nr:multiple epidermal growth factor-like domains protein 10 [Crassostrea angulata]
MDGKYCCQGYKLDLAQNKCIPCGKGFKEINCVSKCPYPMYGQGCQSVCSCNVTECDHVKGCIQSSGGTSNKTTDNTTNYHTAVCETKITKQEKLHSLMAARSERLHYYIPLK